MLMMSPEASSINMLIIGRSYGVDRIVLGFYSFAVN
jgi:hypothetical protein